MDRVVIGVGLILAIACFVIYTVEVIRHRKGDAAATVTRNLTQAASAQNAPPLNLGDLAKLAESLAKLTDSLSKAGPTLTSLIAAILFLAIAAAITVAPHTAADVPEPQQTPVTGVQGR